MRVPRYFLPPTEYEYRTIGHQASSSSPLRFFLIVTETSKPRATGQEGERSPATSELMACHPSQVATSTDAIPMLFSIWAESIYK